MSGEPEGKPATLTLVRHGQSEWNLANRFTGWVDVDLTARGIAEAREAGRALKADGAQFDLVVTSSLRRAVRTSCLLLSGVSTCWVPMLKDVRLNEQHSGAMTGRNKVELANEYGQELVMQWRRGFDVPPPPISIKAPLQRTICEDERYRRQQASSSGASGGPSYDVLVPNGESFRDCLERVRAVWEDTLRPSLHAGKNVLVVSHGNTLRALIKLIDGVGDSDAFHLDMPTACPLVYQLDAHGIVQGGPHGTWGDSSVRRNGRFLYDDERVVQAQQMMRSQVLRNIAVSTITSSNSSSSISICDAWSEDGVSSTRVAVGEAGEDFNVRTLGKPERQPVAQAEEGFQAIFGEDIDKSGPGLEAQLTPATPATLEAPSYVPFAGRESDALSSELSAQASLELANFAYQITGDPQKRWDDRRLIGDYRRLGGAGGLKLRQRQQAAQDTSAPPREREPRCSLILLRHGYSEWNEANLFTGWADPPLTSRGRDEARLAGSLLRAAGIGRIERVYSSLHERAIKTAWLLLDEMELQWVLLIASDGLWLCSLMRWSCSRASLSASDCH